MVVGRLGRLGMDAGGVSDEPCELAEKSLASLSGDDSKLELVGGARDGI